MNKPQNTPENKARFFALYWGQKILLYSDGHSDPFMVDYDFDLYIDKAYLELTPLSQISDEDATIVVGIVKSKGMISSAMRDPKEYCIRSIGKTLFEISDVVDYLRSKGHALPFMGLSVDDLVSYGWVRLKLKEGGKCGNKD